MIYEIETEEDYQQGLKRFLEICSDLKNEDEEKELYLLMALMEKYERENCSSN
jgi:Trp operon repressor